MRIFFSMSRTFPRSCDAGSLWHKGACNRTFPCMEANYELSYQISQLQARVSKDPTGLFACLVRSLCHKITGIALDQ